MTVLTTKLVGFSLLTAMLLSKGGLVGAPISVDHSVVTIAEKNFQIQMDRRPVTIADDNQR